MSFYDLLPPNSTQLERDLSRSVSFIPKLERGIRRIRTAKRIDIPSDVLPWLIYEYGLGDISRYHPDFLTVIIKGIAWQRIRGTPASILEAVGWLGYTPEIDEEEERHSTFWADYHLGFSPQPPAEEDLHHIYFLATRSNPARTRTQRIFSNWDFRLLRWDEDPGGWSEGRMWSDHSGIRGVEGLGDAQLSLMRIRYGKGETDPNDFDPLALRIGLGMNGLPWLWTWSDTGIYSDRWHDLTPPQVRIEIRVGGNGITSGIGWPNTPWPGIAWADASGLVQEGGIWYQADWTEDQPPPLALRYAANGFPWIWALSEGAAYSDRWHDLPAGVGVRYEAEWQAVEVPPEIVVRYAANGFPWLWMLSEGAMYSDRWHDLPSDGPSGGVRYEV